MIIFNEKNHTYHNNGILLPSVTQILLDEGLIDATWYTEEGRQRGSEVHKDVVSRHVTLCHALSRHSKYLEAYDKFLKDTKWKPHTIEQPMANDRFAGTPDQIGFFSDEEEAIIDVKTGAWNIAIALQLEGYDILYLTERMKKAEVFTTRTIIKKYSLHLSNDGKYKLIPQKDRRLKYVFESAVSLWWFKKNEGLR